MKITRVESTVLRLPDVLANGDGVQDLLLVQVHTDEGIVGIGEAHTMPTVLRAIIDAPVSQSAARGLAEIIVGQDPMRVEHLWDLMYAQTAVLGRRGLVIHAMSAIDIALWDIVGKVVGVPVNQLLGGARRQNVRAYASDLMADSPAELVDTASRFRDRGFTAMKFGWGGLGADARRDDVMLADLRAAVGDEVDLMLDLGMPVPFESALRYVESAADHGLVFLEEPLSADDLDGYARLAQASRVPIATGEKETTRHSFIQLMDVGDLAIIQPDLARAGGITEARRIVSDAESRGRDVIPHSWASDILLAATLHVLATTKDARFLEYNVTDNPLRTDLLVEPIRPDEHGMVNVPRGPGLGIELNLDTVEKYRWEPSR